jgi:hypothetical protein
MVDTAFTPQNLRDISTPRPIQRSGDQRCAPPAREIDRPTNPTHRSGLLWHPAVGDRSLVRLSD